MSFVPVEPLPWELYISATGLGNPVSNPSAWTAYTTGYTHEPDGGYWEADWFSIPTGHFFIGRYTVGYDKSFWSAVQPT